MIYKVVYTKTAFSDINKLDVVQKKTIKVKIEAYSKQPLFYAKKLINSAIGNYRRRVGDYRIIFDIDKQNIVILRVGHRKDIYR